jgi:hypothetical protein
MEQNKNVSIEIGYVAKITPGSVSDVLQQELSYDATEFRRGGALGYEWRRLRPQMFRHDDDGALEMPPGMVPLVVAKLRQAGYQVAVNDHRRLLPLDSSILAAHASRPSDTEFLEALACQPRGLIEARTSQDVIELTALICKACPRANIAVFLGTKVQMRRFREKLAFATGQRIHTVNSYMSVWPFEGGRMVGSCTLFGKIRWGFENDFGVIIIPDIRQATGPKCLKAISELFFPRIYGFVRHDEPLGASIRTRLQAYLGPVIYRAPDPRGAPASVEVHWCHPPLGCPPVGDVDALERKRLGYWHNDKRNDMIATIASAFSTGDLPKLWEHGLLLHQANYDLAPSGGMPAVKIVVESTEHGRELLERLPGWEFHHLVPGRATAANTLRSPFVRPLRVITTLATVMKLEIVDTDILIRASPDDLLALNGFPPRVPWPGHTVLLVDLADDFDTRASSATRRRVREYEARGWTSCGAPAWIIPGSDPGPSRRRGHGLPENGPVGTRTGGKRRRRRRRRNRRRT